MYKRVMFASPHSGSGKTLITCGVLRALRSQLHIKSFKSGPDYIDPMFHERVLHVDSENIDSWFMNKEQLLSTYKEAAFGYDLSVMEGAMGLYDGVGGTSEEGSAYHIACITRTPIILIVDAHGMGRSILATLKGFLDYDREKLIKGIILNRVSSSFYERLKGLVEKELGVPVVGYLPNSKEFKLESRHLGLILPGDFGDIEKKLEAIGRQVEESIDLHEICKVAEQAEVLPSTEMDGNDSVGDRMSGDSVRLKPDAGVGPDQLLKLAVARDEAFCFYYEANLRMLRNQGIEIVYFSPVHDRELPADIDGLLLGGGYPELYLKSLSENVSMRESIKSRIEKGIPTLAECGGFMYLQKEIVGHGDKKFPMVGYLDGSVFDTDHSVRFGYVSLSENQSHFLPDGMHIKGHEFHYYDTTLNGNDCIATKPGSGIKWECVVENNRMFLGFAHLYYPSAPEFVVHFREEMERYHGEFI